MIVLFKFCFVTEQHQLQASACLILSLLALVSCSKHCEPSWPRPLRRAFENSGPCCLRREERGRHALHATIAGMKPEATHHLVPIHQSTLGSISLAACMTIKTTTTSRCGRATNGKLSFHVANSAIATRISSRYKCLARSDIFGA